MNTEQIRTVNIPIETSGINLQEFNKLFLKLDPVLKKIQRHLLQHAQNNAPDDATHALRNSLYVKTIIGENSVIFECGSSLPSALKIHEEPYKNVTGYMSTIEGGVGNKYFTRVIDYWIPTYTDWITEVVIKFLDEMLLRNL